LGPVLRAPIVDAAPLDAQDTCDDGRPAVNGGGDEQHYIEEEGADHEKCWKPGGTVTGCWLLVIWTPLPARHDPMRVNERPVAFTNVAASLNSAGNVTSSSNSSPLAAAPAGGTPGQHGSSSIWIATATPDAAAMCPASWAKPSEMSIIAVARGGASHCPALMRGSGLA